MTWQTNSTSSADTGRLGELLGKRLKAPLLIELRSDLGGGKTTFVRGLARGFGSKDLATSPTFTLFKIYKNDNGQAIHHFDFYRLAEPGIVADQLVESLRDNKVITVVEWGDIVKNVLPAERISVEFKPVPDNESQRSVIFRYPESSSSLVRELEGAWAKVKL